MCKGPVGDGANRTLTGFSDINILFDKDNEFLALLFYISVVVGFILKSRLQ